MTRVDRRNIQDKVEKDGRGQVIPDTMVRCLDSSLSILGSLWVTFKPKSNVILVGRS